MHFFNHTPGLFWQTVYWAHEYCRCIATTSTLRSQRHGISEIQRIILYNNRRGDVHQWKWGRNGKPAQIRTFSPDFMHNCSGKHGFFHKRVTSEAYNLPRPKRPRELCVRWSMVRFNWTQFREYVIVLYCTVLFSRFHPRGQSLWDSSMQGPLSGLHKLGQTWA